MPTPPDLESRLHRIERELRAWRLGAVALAGLAAAMSCGKQEQPKWPSVIEGSLTIQGNGSRVVIAPDTISIEVGDSSLALHAEDLAFKAAAGRYASFGLGQAWFHDGENDLRLGVSAVGPELVASGKPGRAELGVREAGATLRLEAAGSQPPATGTEIAVTAGPEHGQIIIRDQELLYAGMTVAQGVGEVAVGTIGQPGGQSLSTAKR